jgi:hypothetical protein
LRAAGWTARSTCGTWARACAGAASTIKTTTSSNCGGTIRRRCSSARLLVCLGVLGVGGWCVGGRGWVGARPRAREASGCSHAAGLPLNTMAGGCGLAACTGRQTEALSVSSSSLLPSPHFSCRVLLSTLGPAASLPLGLYAYLTWSACRLAFRRGGEGMGHAVVSASCEAHWPRRCHPVHGHDLRRTARGACCCCRCWYWWRR